MKLADCVGYLSRGKSPNYVDRSEITVINQACIYWDGINSSKVKYHNPNSAYEKAVLQNGDVLINSTGTGTLGRAAVYYDFGEITIADSHVTIIRTDKNKVLPEFLCLYLRHESTQKELYSKCVSGSTNQIELSKEKLLSFPMPEIPVEVQHDIVKRLGKISRIITIRNKELSTLDDLIKARFVELFGRPEDKKYSSVRLGDYAKLQGGYAFKSKDFVDEGVPLVQIGNVNKDYLDWDVVNAVPEEYIDKYSEFALSKDDLVMAMTRPIIKSLNSVKIAKVAEADLPCLLNQRVGRFQIKNKIHPVFLEILCKTDDFKDYVERMSGNSLQPNISSKQVEDYIIILPPIELQEQFAEFVKQIDKSKSAIQKSLDETQILFDSLMQKYFG